jgi:putative addiction module antidote
MNVAFRKAMSITIRKIGNSEGIIIPKEVLDQMGLKAGDTIDMVAEGNRITLSTDEDMSRQLAHAAAFMDKYKVALKKLAE